MLLLPLEPEGGEGDLCSKSEKLQQLDDGDSQHEGEGAAKVGDHGGNLPGKREALNLSEIRMIFFLQIFFPSL